MVLRSFVLIDKDGRYLLIREAASKWKGKWFLPGGKVLPDEAPETAAHREVKEEAGCDITLNGLFYFWYTTGFLDNHLSLFYAAKITGEEIIKQSPDSHSLEVKWFTPEEILSLPVRQGLLEILQGYNKNIVVPVGNFKVT